LGVDRDSVRVAQLFDERNEAVRRACADLITVAHRAGRPVGICGQAPSDYPEFAAFLVQQGIDSISLNADAFVRTKRRIKEAEQGAHVDAGSTDVRRPELAEAHAV
jgi:pyruvate,water dikinase